MSQTVTQPLLSVLFLLLLTHVHAQLPNYKPSGLPIRDGMEAKLRSMYKPRASGVVCSTCLLANIGSRNMGQNSETFRIGELASRLAKYPADAQAKLKVLQMGVQARTTFEGSSINVGSTEAKRSTFFGMGERNGDIVKIAMIKGEVYGALVPKYHTYEKETCYRHWLFWTKCDKHKVDEHRGPHGHEIQQMEAALMSETLKLFHMRLSTISV